MKRTYLEGLGLEKEVIDKVMAEHGRSVQENNSRLTTSEATLIDLQEQLANRDADIEALKTDTTSSDELKQQLEELQTKYDADQVAFTTKLSDTQKNAAIELALTNAKSLNLKATKALLDIDKLEVKDGAIVGLDEQLTAVQTENPFLFSAPEKPETTPNITTGGNPTAGSVSDDDPFTAKLAKYQ